MDDLLILDKGEPIMIKLSDIKEADHLYIIAGPSDQAMLDAMDFSKMDNPDHATSSPRRVFQSDPSTDPTSNPKAAGDGEGSEDPADEGSRGPGDS